MVGGLFLYGGNALNGEMKRTSNARPYKDTPKKKRFIKKYTIGINLSTLHI